MKYQYLLILSLFLLSMYSCKTSRFIFYGEADIDDYKRLKVRPIEKPYDQFSFIPTKEQLPFDTLTYSVTKKSRITQYSKTFKEILNDTETSAFLVIRNDSILFENYFNDYKREDLVNSFSTSKSILSLLIGIAIEEGFIKSIKDPITHYLPEFRNRGFDKIEIQHLLQMTSGIDFKEIYGPFTDAANLYYGRNIVKELSKLKMAHEPGTHFHYSSADSQLLGLVLSRALKEISISDFLSKRVWQPLGMEFDASWIIDEKGLERAFCCINATAIDFAKIGRLYLQDGSWNSEKIVAKSWIEQTIKYDEKKKLNPEKHFYNYNWYINPDGTFHTKGYKGQYIYVDKKNQLILVRLGEKQGDMDWPTLFQDLSRRYQIENQ